MKKHLSDIIRGNEDLTRRDFIDLGKEVTKDTSKGYIAFQAVKMGIPLIAFFKALGCMAQEKVNLQKTLDNYSQITNNWDILFGPRISTASYGGDDFKGHLTHHIAKDMPGVDYDVPIGTPIVPAANAFLHKIGNQEYGGLAINLRHITNGLFRTVYGHLYDNIVDKRYYHGKSPTQRLITRNEVIAYSGNSGRGRGGYQHPHLHFGFTEWIISKDGHDYHDPEKNGIDGGKPVYWDDKTPLDMRPWERVKYLEKTLGNFQAELSKWKKEDKDLQELKGNLLEYYLLMGNVKGWEILDSKHFHDLRELLKKVTLGEKRFTPSTDPYSLMLQIVGYSTDEKQQVILTLPFISPELTQLYKEPAYEQGKFLYWRMYGGKGK